MSVDVFTAVTINRPRDVVARYAVDPDHATRWYVNIKTVEWKTQKPLAIGSQIAFVAHFLGKRLVYTYEVVDLIPEEHMTMRTAQGPFPMEMTYAWEAVTPTATRMTLGNRGEPSGFSALLAPLMEMAMRGANQKDLLRLKEILEA